jgi:hypothetical protein
MSLQVIFAREDLFGSFAPYVRAREPFSSCVCRFVTLAVCTNTECLSAASIGACETVVVRLGNMLTAII